MIKLKRILAPTDFSEYSKSALNYACEFAETFGAELHLLHVLQDIAVSIDEPGLAFASTGDFMAEYRAGAERSLEKILDSEWEKGKQVVRELVPGVPFLEIIRYAAANDIDLIVIGTHGRTGLAHVLMGSAAEKVVRKASCPVLTVRHPEHEFIMP